MDLSERIRLSGGLYANVADKAAEDAIQGAYVWNVTKVVCPMICFYVNSSTTASLKNSKSSAGSMYSGSGFGSDAKLSVVHSHCLEDTYAGCDSNYPPA